MEYNRIAWLINQRRRKVENLAPEIGMTGAGLRRAIQFESLKAKDFEKLCRVLDINPMFFFEEKMDFKHHDGFFSGGPKGISRSEGARLKEENIQLKEEIRSLQAKIIDLMEVSKVKK